MVLYLYYVKIHVILAWSFRMEALDVCLALLLVSYRLVYSFWMLLLTEVKIAELYISVRILCLSFAIWPSQFATIYI